MEPIVLTDPAITPDKELITSIIGDKSVLWDKIMEHLYSQHKDISEVWRYYNDGKCWLFRTLKREKTIFWVGVQQNTFRVGFWLSDKAEPLIEKSNLPESVKNDFRNAKVTKIGRGLGIVINTLADAEAAIKMAELKIKLN